MIFRNFLEDAAVDALLRVLNPEPDATRIVGGAVRNALLNEPVGDIDLATKLTPQQVEKLCMAAGFRAVPTGIDYGTVTVVVERRAFEVTTLREDIETDGRHAVVKFGTSWEKDAARRDFTINAFYLDANGEVHAPLGGLDDIKARRMRFIGDARERIREDYLRIWRFFRFSAQYAAGDFDSAGTAACLREKNGLAQLSAERVRQELFKLLVANRAAEALQTMSDLGLTLPVLGVQRIELFKKLAENDVAQGRTGDALERLAALSVWTESDASRLAEKLRLSRAEAQQLNDLAVLQMKMRAMPGEKQARVLLYHHPQAYAPASRIASAGGGGWKLLPDLPSVPVFPVKGADLVALGHQPGRELGELLRKIEQTWIDSDFTLTKDELLNLI